MLKDVIKSCYTGTNELKRIDKFFDDTEGSWLRDHMFQFIDEDDVQYTCSVCANTGYSRVAEHLSLLCGEAILKVSNSKDFPGHEGICNDIKKICSTYISGEEIQSIMGKYNQMWVAAMYGEAIMRCMEVEDISNYFDPEVFLRVATTRGKLEELDEISKLEPFDEDATETKLRSIDCDLFGDSCIPRGTGNTTDMHERVLGEENIVDRLKKERDNNIKKLESAYDVVQGVVNKSKDGALPKTFDGFMKVGEAMKGMTTKVEPSAGSILTDFAKKSSGCTKTDPLNVLGAIFDIMKLFGK